MIIYTNPSKQVNNKMVSGSDWKHLIYIAIPMLIVDAKI